MRYYVGAYAASACGSGWQPRLEAELYAGLSEMEGVAGLEHPFYGGPHRWDDAWFLAHVDPRWSLLLTCLPGTMDHLAKDARFGLASDDAEGRAAAVRFIAAARETAVRLNDALKRQAVTGVALHAAPRRGVPGVSASPIALRRSLEEIAGWDWAGARLLLEHCDAFVPSHPPDKGFLSLDEELAAAAGLPVAALINWGRSALEARGARGPVDHLRRARGRLGGLMFSGVTRAWRDSHPPFAPAFEETAADPASLMTGDAVRDCLAAAAESGPAGYLGFKIKPLPETLPVSRRLEFLRAGIRILDRCRLGP